MNSSQGHRNSIPARPRRQSRPAGEMLEGRQLLSTATAAAGTPSNAAPVAISSIGGGRLGRHEMMNGRGGEARGMMGGGSMMRGIPFQGLPFAPTSTTTAAAPTGTSSSTAATAAPTTPAGAPTVDPTSTTAATPSTTPTTSSTGPVWSSGSTDQGGGSGPMGSGQGMVAPGMGFGSGGFGGGGFGQGMSLGSGMGFGGGMGGFGGGMGGGFDGSGSIETAPSGGSGTSSSDPSAAAFQQYQTDVQAIADKSQVTPALRSALRNDLQAISKAATTAPDQTKVLALQSDLQTLAGTLPTSDQLATLQADFTAVANSEGVTSTTEIGQTFTDLNALIAATDITSSDITTLTSDLKAVGLSTAAPLGHGLGIDLSILDLAINEHAGQASTSSTPSSASGSSSATSSTS